MPTEAECDVKIDGRNNLSSQPCGCERNFKRLSLLFSFRNSNNFQLKLKREKRFVSFFNNPWVWMNGWKLKVKWKHSTRLSIIRIKCSVSKCPDAVLTAKSLNRENIKLQLLDNPYQGSFDRGDDSRLGKFNFRHRSSEKTFLDTGNCQLCRYGQGLL